MAQHARRSASQTKLRRNCPGSLPFTDTLPRDGRGGSSVYAQMGTCAHALVERCLSEGSAPADYEGRIIAILHGEDGEEKGTSILRKGAKAPKDPTAVWFEVDRDMVDAVDVAVDYVNGRMEGMGLARDQLRLEQRVVPLPDRDDTGGTGDVIMDDWPDMLEVADYKHGAGVVVEVTDNDQTRSYLLGAARLDGFSHDWYRHTIVQPNAPHEDGAVRSQDISRDELLAFEAELREIEERVDLAEAELDAILEDETKWDTPFHETASEWFGRWLEPGEHCKSCFCDARPHCPALRAAVQREAGADFEDDPDGPLPVPTGLEGLKRARAWVPVIDSWCREVEALVQRLLEEDVDGSASEALGAKLVRKKSNRAWVAHRPELDDEGEPVVDEETGEVRYTEEEATPEWIVGQLTGRFGLEEKDLFGDPKMVTGPQAEKLVPRGQRKLLNRLLLHKPPGGITVASADDPRDAVRVRAADDFPDEEG